MRPPHTRSTLFPYTTLFRSVDIAVEYFLNRQEHKQSVHKFWVGNHQISCLHNLLSKTNDVQIENSGRPRSEEHTSELQSRGHLVCRLLLEKKKTKHEQTQA